jgi:LasA protease
MLIGQRRKTARVIERGSWLKKSALFLLIAFFIVSCQGIDNSIRISPAVTLSPSSSITKSQDQKASSTPISTLTPTPVPPTPTLSPTLDPWPPATWLFPDSEVVFSISAIEFDVAEFNNKVGGFLNTYEQYLMITGWTTGSDIVFRVAIENSINPRLLLALLEYQSGCVLGQVEDPDEFDTAMGAVDADRLDLYGQLVWAVHELSEGFYGWKSGDLKEFTLTDGTLVSPLETTNAGTVAIQYFFGQLYDSEQYDQTQNPIIGFYALYEEMFSNAWERAIEVEPLISIDILQPFLTLPFAAGKAWAFTGGPHYAFEGSGPKAALDFSPPSSESGCYQSEDWVTAMADGLVIRSEFGVVTLDLDSDGFEQTGWVLMYLHIEDRDRVPSGTMLKIGDPIGHPSCEGGRATGTHVHIARKYNGEWIPAAGELPFVMDGWVAHEGEDLYLGTLTRGDAVVTAHQYGSFISRISRDE